MFIFTENNNNIDKINLINKTYFLILAIHIYIEKKLTIKIFLHDICIAKKTR